MGAIFSSANGGKFEAAVEQKFRNAPTNWAKTAHTETGTQDTPDGIGISMDPTQSWAIATTGNLEDVGDDGDGAAASAKASPSFDSADEDEKEKKEASSRNTTKSPRDATQGWICERCEQTN